MRSTRIVSLGLLPILAQVCECHWAEEVGECSYSAACVNHGYAPDCGADGRLSYSPHPGQTSRTCPDDAPSGAYVYYCASPKFCNPGVLPNKPPTNTPKSSHNACDEYAREAVRQYRTSVAWGCGYSLDSGGVWSSNFNHHYGWCRRNDVSETDLRNGSNLRKELLSDCRCEEYAYQAIRQYKKSVVLGCGYSGAEWRGNRDYHFDWCKHGGVSETDLRNGSNLRKEQLANCRRDNPDRACREYADEAVSQYNAKVALSCGYTGAEWRGSFDYHYSWCKHSDVSEKDVRDGSTLRKESLFSCIDRLTQITVCRDYSNQAINQNEAAKALDCRYTGPVWQSDYEHHRDWCVGEQVSAMQRGDHFRRQKLKNCIK